MNWPVLPIVLRVKRGKWPAFWLPVVLLWPLVLCAFCLALPVCLVLPARHGAFETLAAAYRTLCAMHGSEFEVGSPEHGDWTFSVY